MITCPLCGRYVVVAENESGNYLFDDEPDDFKCPTRVTIKDPFTASHYERVSYIHNDTTFTVSSRPKMVQEYVAILPPFSVSWEKDNDGLLKAETIKLHHGPKAVFLAKELNIQSVPNASFQDFVNLCFRLQKLRVFI